MLGPGSLDRRQSGLRAGLGRPLDLRLLLLLTRLTKDGSLNAQGLHARLLRTGTGLLLLMTQVTSLNTLLLSHGRTTGHLAVHLGLRSRDQTVTQQSVLNNAEQKDLQLQRWLQELLTHLLHDSTVHLFLVRGHETGGLQAADVLDFLLVVVDNAMFTHVTVSEHVGGQATQTLVIRGTGWRSDGLRVRGVEVSDSLLGLRDLSWLVVGNHGLTDTWVDTAIILTRHGHTLRVHWRTHVSVRRTHVSVQRAHAASEGSDITNSRLSIVGNLLTAIRRSRAIGVLVCTGSSREFLHALQMQLLGGPVKKC